MHGSAQIGLRRAVGLGADDTMMVVTTSPPDRVIPTLSARMSAAVDALVAWVDESGGIVHRDAADEAGHPVSVRRTAVRVGAVDRVRRLWLATAAAPAPLRAAATDSAHLACISAARWRGWWMPPSADDRLHLSIPPHGRTPAAPEITVHWSHRLAPAPSLGLVESVEDALAHIAQCLSFEDAQAVWDSAIVKEGLSPEALRQVRWRTSAARRCADRATTQSDSGLETRMALRLIRLGVAIRQQVELLGRPVDLVIGEWLVVQIDGFAHHSTSAQRTKDVAFDAQLVLMGYTVLRFTYAQVMHDWETVERTIARAIATGAHLDRRSPR